LLNKSITLEEQQHPDEAMVVYDEVVRRLSGASEPRLRALVASALISNALILQLKHPDRALAAYDEVLRIVGHGDRQP
jgi:hypothetical protein